MEASRKPVVPDETGTYIGSMTTEDGGESFVPPADQNPSQFTFYRESTPPPLPLPQDNAKEKREKDYSRSAIPLYVGMQGLIESGGDSSDNEMGHEGDEGRSRAGATIC